MRAEEMKQHLTIDELMDRLYGCAAVDHLADHHLGGCEECSRRFAELRARRETAAETAPVSYEFLAAQRRNIYARMGERPQPARKWLPALAAALCLAGVGVIAHHPAAQLAKPEAVDPQLFSDVYSMEQSMEPLAAQPMHALFDQDQR